MRNIVVDWIVAICVQNDNLAMVGETLITALLLHAKISIIEYIKIKLTDQKRMQNHQTLLQQSFFQISSRLQHVHQSCTHIHDHQLLQLLL